MPLVEWRIDDQSFEVGEVAGKVARAVELLDSGAIDRGVPNLSADGLSHPKNGLS